MIIKAEDYRVQINRVGNFLNTLKNYIIVHYKTQIEEDISERIVKDIYNNSFFNANGHFVTNTYSVSLKYQEIEDNDHQSLIGKVINDDKNLKRLAESYFKGDLLNKNGHLRFIDFNIRSSLIQAYHLAEIDIFYNDMGYKDYPELYKFYDEYRSKERVVRDVEISPAWILSNPTYIIRGWLKVIFAIDFPNDKEDK